MRDLKADLKWLTLSQSTSDLSDGFLKARKCNTRERWQGQAYEFAYGITFVESTIAREWLERAIKASGGKE